MMKKILLFPAAWSDAETVFGPQINALQDQFDFIIPDIHQFDSIEGMAEHVVSEYQDVYAMIGLSLGGFVVQQIASFYPNYAEKIVLMGTQAESYEENTDAQNTFKSLIDAVETGQLENLLQEYVNAVLSKVGKQNSAIVDAVQKTPLNIGAKACANHHKACLQYKDMRETVRKITADTLIICAERDGCVSMESSELLHNNIKGSNLVLIADAAHFMTLERPEIVTEHIRHFLSDH